MSVRIIVWRVFLVFFVITLSILLLSVSELNSQIVLPLIVGVGSIFPIKDYILCKKMILGKFNLEPDRVFLRAFFFGSSIFTISVVFFYLAFVQ